MTIRKFKDERIEAFSMSRKKIDVDIDIDKDETRVKWG